MGLADDEIRVEARYLPEALEIVGTMWRDSSADEIALEIYRRTGFRQVTTRLVYALKARLDTTERNRSK